MTGLRGRLVVALVATSLATLVTTSVVVLPTLEGRLERDRLAELRELTRAVRPALRAVPARDRRPGSLALLRIADRLQVRTGGRIAVYGRSGDELADTAESRIGTGYTRADVVELSEAALRRRDGVVTGERDAEAYAATVVGRSDRVTLVITKGLDDSRAAASVLRAALPLALAVGLAVALGLALLLSRSLMRRLAHLRADAEAIGTEGLDHRVTVSGADEVAVVARALETMRERLVVEQQAREDFLATASHELRTPLASLQATLELLREELDRGVADQQTTVPRTDAALRQTSRLAALAGDLLDLSRVDSGAPLRLEPLELAELATTIAGEFAARLETAGRSLRLEGGPALALADPAAAARIVRILLDNAVKYGAGTVTVTITPEAGQVQLAVEDKGPGIPGDGRDRIFQRFVRGHGAAGSAAGAGLGLPIARGLARAMGGELVAEPALTGARFVLTVPAA